MSRSKRRTFSSAYFFLASSARLRSLAGKSIRAVMIRISVKSSSTVKSLFILFFHFLPVVALCGPLPPVGIVAGPAGGRLPSTSEGRISADDNAGGKIRLKTDESSFKRLFPGKSV